MLTGRNARPSFGSQNGFAVLLIIPIVAIFLFFGIFVFIIFFAKPMESGTVAGAANKDTNNKIRPGDTYNKPQDGNTYQPYGDDSDIQDLSTGYLVCVSLPGVSYPRTPALDRRVARRYLSAKQNLDQLGIRLSFSWGFRTTCQQAHLDAEGNLKAKPGTSPHEAGRAIDVRGMTSRPDAGTIAEIFKRHGFFWLGRKDPPHFEIKGYTVGESSHLYWIQKAQEDFHRGGPAGGCRGTECGQ